MGAQNYQIVLDGGYVGGVDSLLYPTDLGPGTYAWAVNIVNRGGVVQTRPGKRKIVSFCGRRAQGHYWARTIDDRNYEMVAIDGLVYWSALPFGDGWTQLAGVKFNPDADWVYFQNSIQAAYYDAGNNIAILPGGPKNVVYMQDGSSWPCYFDLSDFSSGVIDEGYVGGDPASPMPVGTAMLWQDNRIWLAADELVYASDLLFGASFNEDTYLATGSGFRFPRKVVNLFPAPVQGVQVYTESSIHGLASYVQDRGQWQTTQGFQSDINLEVGLVGPFAYGLLHGMPWILTHRGLISYDRALTSNLTTLILTVDGEMMRSKDLLAPDVSGAVIGVWENILLVAVPASALQNRHTWIMDAGIAEKLNNTMGTCWSGIWVGTFPVQFTSPIFNGTQHNYELSYSGGFLAVDSSPSPQPETDLPIQANIHLWENFIPNQIDNSETSVNCSFETKAFTLTTDDYYRFVFAEFMLVNLKGIVPVQVYVTGLAGNYQPLFSTTLRADIGPFGNPVNATLYYANSEGGSTKLENYRRQVRHMRTKEFVVKEENNTSDGAACLEIGRPDGIDKAFQLMIQWQGRLGLRMIKFFYDRQLQSPQGVCPVDESGTPHIILESTYEPAT